MLEPARGSPAHTHTHTQRFALTYEFPVVFTAGVFDSANPVLADTLARWERESRHRCLIFVDDGLLAAQPGLRASIIDYARQHEPRMELLAEPIAMPGGERIKSDLHFVEAMQRAVYEHEIDRHSYVIGIGGGALLDAVGLVAATSHRGVRHVRIPTTVLAQNDSGVGVKNGVNLYGVKNFVGTFAPPFAVINDFDLLGSLPERDKIAGIAEAVKVALIRDGEFFAWLERHAEALHAFDPAAMEKMIRRCAQLHMAQIADGGDPFETGSARPLDYGHWSAHRLESLTHYHLRHGEAVAIGIALDARYAVTSGLLSTGKEERIARLLERVGFWLWHPALAMRDALGHHAVLQGLREFREHLGGELTITLLCDLGVGVDVHAMDEQRVLDAIAWLEQRTGG